MDTAIRICVVDDEVAIRNMLATFLRMRGYEVSVFNDGVDALDDPVLFESGIVISDLNMPIVDGLTLLRQVKEKNPETICILITGMATLDSTINALRAGIDDYILKPFDLKDLERIINKNMSRLHLKIENEKLQEDILRERNLLKQKNTELEIINDILVSLRSAYDVNLALEKLSDKFEDLFAFDYSFYYSVGKGGITGSSRPNVPDAFSRRISELLKNYFDDSGAASLHAHLKEKLAAEIPEVPVTDLMVATFHSGERVIGTWGFLKIDNPRFSSKQKEDFHYLFTLIQGLLQQIDTIVGNQNRMLSSIFNQIQSIIIRVDLDSGGILTNKPGLDLFRKGEAELRFEDVRQVFGGDWDAVLDEIRQEGLSRKIFVTGDERDSLAYGVSVIEYSDPPFIERGLLINAKDITDQKKIEDMKADLISNVSHELKTPLAIVKEYISLLHDQVGGPLNEMQQGFIRTIGGNLDRLERIIGNFLDMSRLSSGKLLVRISPQSVPEVLNEIIEPFQIRYKNKGMSLTINIPDPELTFPMDKDIMAQILVNLLENAYKYAGDNSKVELETAINDDGNLFIAVRDNGKGIPRKDQKKIFDRFFRAGLEEDVRQPGSGLGLAIIKDMVELLGGRIWLESEVGSGSSFYVELPPGNDPDQE